MWDFLRYTSRERAFGFSQSALETTRAGAGAEARAKVGAEAQASRTALKIHYKSFSEYLGTLVVVAWVSTMGDFISKGPMGYLNNLSPNLGGGKKSERATKRVIEGAMEGCSRQRRPWPQTEVILVQTFF